jgi:hypothetical protein
MDSFWILLTRVLGQIDDLVISERNDVIHRIPGSLVIHKNIDIIDAIYVMITYDNIKMNENSD